MNPFGSFLYFGLLLYVLIAVVAARLFSVRPRIIIFVSTVVVLTGQYALTDHGLSSEPVRNVARVFVFAIVQWVIAQLFLRVRAAGKNQPAFYAAVALALVPLAWEKFSPSSAAHVVAFAGISYTTFRALDAIICIQDKLIVELPLTEFVAFVLFFPAISAGPIDRYRRFRTDYEQERSRADLLLDLDRATERIFRGVLYSFIVAPLIDFYWLAPASRARGVLALASYTYAYSIHLFFDFAGYSAFAIGVGYIVGVRSLENFNRPFLATNIADFWNRWHISLSSWLRDHVYGRFVLAAKKGRWFTGRYTPGYIGSILAFGLMGLWHGPSLHYLVYGMYHATLIVGHAMYARPDRVRRVHIPPFVGRVLTFNAVCVGFLIFSGRLF
ncbi:MAG: MBOAT family O-acyltransferase [bacterium]